MNPKQIRRNSFYLRPSKTIESSLIKKEPDVRRNSTIGLALDKQRYIPNVPFYKIKEEEEEDNDDTLSLMDMLNEEQTSPCDFTTDELVPNQSVSSLDTLPTLSSFGSNSETKNTPWMKAIPNIFRKKKNKEPSINRQRRDSIESALELEAGKLRIKNNSNFDEVLRSGFYCEKENKPTLRISLTPKIAKDDANRSLAYRRFVI